MSGNEQESEGPRGFKSGVFAHRNGVNQNFGGLGWAKVEFTTTQFDRLGEWFTGAGNWFFRPRRPGFYFIAGSVKPFSAIPAGQSCQMDVRITAFPFNLSDWRMGDGSSYCFTHVAAVLYLTPANALSLWWQTSIAAPNDTLSGSPAFTNLSIHRVS